MRRLAVCDLGSNSFRMVVFVASDEGWWRRVDEIYEPVRVGEGLAATGELQPEPMARAQDFLEVFAHFAKASALPASEVEAVATSAIRDAANGPDFLKAAKRRSGLDVRVLSKEEEARYGYLAAVNSTSLADGCVLDIGGGSMQLVQVRGRLATASDSWRLGAVRMTERFLPDGEKASKKQLDKLRAHVATKLERAPWLPRSGTRLIGIGGTVRNLATAAQKAAGLPDVGVQGQVVSLAALDETIAALAALPASDRAKVPGIKLSRQDLILAGAVVVRTVLEVGGFDDGLETTEAGLREGVFFERHLEAGGEDPPLWDDVRRRSVLNLAAQYPTGGPEHTAHVAHLALTLFDDLCEAGLHPGDPIERELLWAASLLHDVGMTVDYDDHHKHSRYLVLNAGLPGFSPREVALIAQAVRYHRKGMPSFGELAPLLTGKHDDRVLDRLAVILRLAEDLERSRDQAVRGTHATVVDGEVRLSLDAPGDLGAVPRWAASRELHLFERAFGHKLVVV